MSVQITNTAAASSSFHTNGPPAVKYPAPKPVNTAVVALMVAKPIANDASRPTERSSFWVYPKCSSLAYSALAGSGTFASAAGTTFVMVSPAQLGIQCCQQTRRCATAEVPKNDLLIKR